MKEQERIAEQSSPAERWTKKEDKYKINIFFIYLWIKILSSYLSLISISLSNSFIINLS